MNKLDKIVLRQKVEDILARDEGFYCYSGKDICPYFTIKKVGLATITYCKFLKQGSIGNVTDEEFDYFKDFHKTSNDEDIWNLYPLNLLWDQVKECGINDYWEEEDGTKVY